MARQDALRLGLWLCLPLAAGAALAQEQAGERLLGTGIASYYADSFAGQRTASGEPYRPGALTAAHRSARFGSRIRVHNFGNGREVTVRVNDRGPHVRGRVIDLSRAAARAIGLHRTGTARVSLTLIEN